MSSSPEAAALECAGLSKAFGARTVLDGVDLAVAPRSITAILGPSGGGKTTLLRIVAGFERAGAGAVVLHGDRVDSSGAWVAPERRRVGFVPQEGALFPHLSVAANVGFGLPRRRRAARVAECLELVGLGSAEQARPHELSGGQQQRVALARALAPRPTLVLLDEPFSSLDAGLRAQVRAEVCAVLRHEGATALLVTHDQEEALSVADEVGVLLDGRILQHADPVTLYRAPATLAVAEFVGDAVVLDGRADAHGVTTSLGQLRAATPVAAGEVRVVIRPEQVRLDGGEGAPTARVVDREFTGADAHVALAVAGVDTVIRARVGSDHLVAVDDEVRIRVAGPVSVFPRKPG
jgi:iron(III) transport system ATP-binding protein